MNHFSKAILALAAFIGCYPAYLAAHEGNGVLPNASAATHYYQIDCSGGSAYLFFQVRAKGTAAAPLVSAEMSNGSVAMSTTDPKNTDALYSQGMIIRGGDGSYHVTISKSKAGIAKYSFQYHCKDSQENHTETGITAMDK